MVNRRLKFGNSKDYCRHKEVNQGHRKNKTKCFGEKCPFFNECSILV